MRSDFKSLRNLKVLFEITTEPETKVKTQTGWRWTTTRKS